MKFSESQIVAILKEAKSGLAIHEVVRKRGISKATMFAWRAKCGGTPGAELKRLKELETENRRLKRMYADLAMPNAAINEVLGIKLSRRLRRGR